MTVARVQTALNADIVGYSALIADDFEKTTATVAEYRSLVDDIVDANRGHLTQFVGDNFMALFDDPRDAMRAAIDITSRLEERNADVATTRMVRFRMGLDTGEVTAMDGNHHGDALNIAARIQAISRPGGISVSGRVYQALDEPALRFRPLGPQRLKNIPESVDVYEFADLPTDGQMSGRSRLELDLPTVAVLPIHTQDVADRVRSAAHMIRADLIHRLAQIPELVVTDSQAEPGQAGAVPTARWMLETGVHQFGETVRVYAMLFDVSTMNVVKSHKWTSGVDDMLSLADRIADTVADTIEVDLIVGEPAGLYADFEDPQAIEKVYLGWYHLRSNTEQGLRTALDLFGQVAESNPEVPYGHVLTAFALWLSGTKAWAEDGDATLQQAWEAAQRGIDAGDPTGMARTVHAAILMDRGDPDGALEIMDAVEIVRPTCDVTFGLEGSVRRYMGEWEKAVDLLDVAMRLTGVNKPWYPTVKACSLWVGGRHEQAAEIASEVLEYQPNNLEALLVLAAAQYELGMERRARATAATIAERFPSVDVAKWLDRNPYQDGDLVERWKQDLAEVGAIT
jgi:adenylate cyclase